MRARAPLFSELSHDLNKQVQLKIGLKQEDQKLQAMMNIEVIQSFVENPHTSIRKVSQQCDISKNTVREL